MEETKKDINVERNENNFHINNQNKLVIQGACVQTFIVTCINSKYVIHKD